MSRGLGAAVGEVDDFALVAPVDRGMRLLDKALQALGQPVIAPGLFAVAVHALLHYDPAPVVGDDEAMQIEIEAVLHRGAIDLGDQPARLGERGAVEADLFADRDEFVRRLPRMLAPAAADVKPEFACERGKAAFQRAEHAGGDARGMPVHAHHGAERLEPEGMRQTAEQFVAAVMVDDRLAHRRPEPRHAAGEPGRHTPAMQGEIGAAGALRHEGSLANVLLMF